MSHKHSVTKLYRVVKKRSLILPLFRDLHYWYVWIGNFVRRKMITRIRMGYIWDWPPPSGTGKGGGGHGPQWKVGGQVVLVGPVSGCYWKYDEILDHACWEQTYYPLQVWMKKLLVGGSMMYWPWCCRRSVSSHTPKTFSSLTAFDLPPSRQRKYRC